MTLQKHNDESWINELGEVVIFSAERFQNEIVDKVGENCFVCGAKKSNVEFTAEHIIPNWVLRKLSLHSKSITLPNGFTYRYDKYKLGCCRRCNELLGKKIEDPVRKLVSSGYEAVKQYIYEESPFIFYIWICLIFLKTHLRDTKFLFDQDRRNETQSIGDDYFWDKMHHIHCMVRTVLTGAEYDQRVLGSMYILPIDVVEDENFDFIDLNKYQTVMLRLENIAFFVVLDDAQAVRLLMTDILRKHMRNFPLQLIEARELLARMAITNHSIVKRPHFFSKIDVHNETYRVSVITPDKIECEEFDNKQFGQLFYFCCKDLLKADPTYDEELIDNVKSGRWTYLFGTRSN